MFSVNEYNVGQYSDRILGVIADVRSGAIIRAELNETIQQMNYTASITSPHKILIDGYKNFKATGLIHGSAVHIKTGDGITELGYRGDAIISPVSKLSKIISLYPYIVPLAEKMYFDIAQIVVISFLRVLAHHRFRS